MLKQGATTDIIFRIFENDGITPKALDSSTRVKIIICNSHNMVKYQGNYPDDIKVVEASVYSLTLPNSVTKNFSGDLRMEIAIYYADAVLICKERVEMFWKPYVIGNKIYED